MMQMNTCSTYRWHLCVFLFITFLSGALGNFPSIICEAKQDPVSFSLQGSAFLSVSLGMDVKLEVVLHFPL